jgi:DNA-binding transcriptional LysR family regulator
LVNKMELRDLEYFVKIAAYGNVRRAADELDMSPAALSKCLRRLEQAMNATLVRRTPKGVQLTDVGEALRVQAERIRLTIADATREAQDLSLGQAGHLRIGTSPVALEQTHIAYAGLLQEAPKLSMSITVSDNDMLVPALQQGKLDVIVNLLSEAPFAGCVAEPLFEDDIVVCASNRHPLARRKSVTLADLARERWALSPINMMPWHWLHRAFQTHGLPAPQVAVETRSLRLRLLLVASSTLLGFTSRRVVQQAAPTLRLKEISVKGVAWRRPVGAIYREGGYLSPAGRRFIGILHRTARTRFAASK